MSFVEQGYDRERQDARPPPRRSGRSVAVELDRLNAAYEARFGFRYCVFVAGRSRAALLPGHARPRSTPTATPSSTVRSTPSIDIARDRYAS